MPRLFTGLEIPEDVGLQLSFFRGGLPGARWIEPAHYHITLSFIGDVDGGTARDVVSVLDEARERDPFPVALDALASFGGDRPRAVLARAAPAPDLLDLQAEGERLLRRVGVGPERRRFTPHVTLARLRGASAGDVAGWIATHGRFPRLTFTARRVALFSARDSVGGGPYVVEAAFPFG